MAREFDDLGKQFGIVLAEFREQKHQTQMGLAAEAGLHLNAVSKIERGEQVPNLRTVFALAGALGVSPTKLVAAVEKLVKAD